MNNNSDMRSLMNLVSNIENGNYDIQSNIQQNVVCSSLFQYSVLLEGFLNSTLCDIEGIKISVFGNIVDIVVNGARQIDEYTKVNKYSIVESRLEQLNKNFILQEHEFDEHDNLLKTITINGTEDMIDYESLYQLLLTEKWIGRIGKKYNSVEELKSKIKKVDKYIVQNVLGIPSTYTTNTIKPIIFVESENNTDTWILYGEQELKYIIDNTDIRSVSGYVL